MAMDHRPGRWSAKRKQKSRGREAFWSAGKQRTRADGTEYPSMQTSTMSRIENSDERMNGDSSKISAVLSRTGSLETPVTHRPKNHNEENLESSQEDVQLMAEERRGSEEASENSRTNSTYDNNSVKIHINPDFNKSPGLNKESNSFNLEHNNSFSESGSDSGVAEQESIIISDSDPEQSTPSVSTLIEELDSRKSHCKLHQMDGKEDCIPGLGRVSKQSHGVVKRAMVNVKARRKAFRLLSLRNTHRGSRLLMKNSLKRGRVGKEIQRTTPTFTVSSLGANSVPMEVLVKKKLNFVFEDLSSPANASHKAATPVNAKFNFVSSDTSAQDVVSCQTPCDVSSDTSPSEEFHLHSKEVENPQKGFSSNKKDVCYIYAVLNGEKEEALFKCTPQFKSSHFLQQITSVIETIAADDDVIVSRKVDSSGAAVPNQKAPMIDRATSPIVGFESPETMVVDGEAKGNASDVHQSTNEQLVVVNTTLKVLLSKALLSFTSELKIIVDVSMRLLSWCSAPIRADIDSDMVEDELEAFFCLSHDQVSILLECLSLLDSKQILNVDEAELERFWLLHDALCCMLQVYRYLQSSFLSSSIDQQLLSLLSTCSKLILPTSKLTIEKWADLMKMVCGIGSKLNESECFSDPCKCYQCLESLRINRFCRVCDVSRLHQILCLTEKSTNLVKGPIEEFKESPSNKPVLEQLFPRFCFFLNSIEEWSEEEFKSAIAKHSVVKFSCNMDSGLNPCNLHLSEVVCHCFASHAPLSASEVDPPCLNINSKHSSLPDTSEHQNSVPKLHEDERLPSVKKPALEHNNAEGDVDLHISSSSDSTLRLLNGEGKPDEISASNLPTDDNEGKNCQVQEDFSTKSTETIILDGSSSSADNFTLRIAQSSSETDQDSLSRERSELEETKIDENTDDSTIIINSSGCIESAVKYVVQEENSDSTSENSLSIIPPSSEHSTNCGQSDLMKHVSIGDESVFECSQSSEDLAREESICGNKGSFESPGTTRGNSDVSEVQESSRAEYAESSEAEGLRGDIVSPNCSNSTSTTWASPTDEETELDSSPFMPEVLKRMLHGLNHNAVQSKTSPLPHFKGPRAANRCMEKDRLVRFTQAPRSGNSMSRMETNMSGNTKSASDIKGRKGFKLPESDCTVSVANGIVNHEEMKNLKSKREVNQKNVKSFEENTTPANFQKRNGGSVSAGEASTSSCAQRPKPHKKLQLKKKVNVNLDCDWKRSKECQALLDSEKQVVFDKDAGGPTNDSLLEIRKEKGDIVACDAENDDLDKEHRISDGTYGEAFVMAEKNDESKLYNCVEGGKKGKKKVKFAMDYKPMVGCNTTARERNSGFTGFTVPKKETELRKGKKKCMEEEVERNHSSTFLNSGAKVSYANSKTKEKEKDSKKISVGGPMYMSDLHKEDGASHCTMAADRHRTLGNADGRAGSQSASRKRRYAVDQTSLMSPKPKRNGAECNIAERKSLLPPKLKSKTTSEQIHEYSAQNQKTKKGNATVPCINDNTDSKMNLPKHKESKKADPDLDNSRDWESLMQRMRERYLQRPSLPSNL